MEDVFDYQILKLTDAFYDAYPNPPYSELLTKKGRHYNCLLFQSHYDYFVCIPYRSNVTHKYAYHFKYSKRSKITKSALDYTKIIIINNPEYIESKTSFIDKDEYLETNNNIDIIRKAALSFVDDYIKYCKNKLSLHKEEADRRYKYSTLKIFRDILGC